MMTVACVLKSGGIYTPEWVWALKRGLARHLTGFEFMCLTDVQSIGPWAVPLKHNLPGWWSKLELFRPGVFEGPVLYMDLDTLPVGDLSQIASYTGELALLSDFYRPKQSQSGVMAFTPGGMTARVWERFIADPAANMKRHRGDGEFIRAVMPSTDRLQNLYPGQIVSLKVHAAPRTGGPPKGARLVCGHGNPRFSSPAAGWAHKVWQSINLPESWAA